MNVQPASPSRPPQSASRPGQAAPSAVSGPQDTVSIAQSPDHPSSPPLAKWTILQYAASDNNLYKWIYDDVAMMEKVGSDPTTHLVVEIDHGQQGPKGVERIHLEKDGKAPVEGMARHASIFMSNDSQPNGKISSRTLENLGQQNMADPHTLADFIKWGEEHYPAEHYMLIISDHGDGWKGCCEDDSAKGWMDLPGLKQGVVEAEKATGHKLDVIGFDCCLMANAEVAYELKDHANYLVGSEQTEGANGWPYQAVLNPGKLSAIKSQDAAGEIDLEPADLAVSVVKQAADDQGNLPTMSAIDLSKMEGLAQAATQFKAALMTTDTSGSFLRLDRRNCQSFTGYRDIVDFAQNIVQSDQVTDANLKAKAQGLIDSVKAAVLSEQHSDHYPGAHGLQMEMTRTNTPQYAATDWQQAVDWSAAMSRIDNLPDHVGPGTKGPDAKPGPEPTQGHSDSPDHRPPSFT